MHEDGAVGGIFKGRGVDLIGQQQVDALFPNVLRLAHRDPDVGVEYFRAARAVGNVRGQGNAAAGVLGDLLCGFDQLFCREQRFRRAGGEVHAHLGAGDDERIGHVVARVAHEGELHAGKATQLFLDGQKVGQHLRGVKLVGQAVPHRHAGVFRQKFHRILAETAVFDTVVHAAKHARRVLDALLFAHLRAGWVEEGHAHAQIAPRHFKGAARARGGLFKQQHDVAAHQVPVADAQMLFALQALGQIEQMADFVGRVVQKREETASIQRHRASPFQSANMARRQKALRPFSSASSSSVNRGECRGAFEPVPR